GEGCAAPLFMPPPLQGRGSGGGAKLMRERRAEPSGSASAPCILNKKQEFTNISEKRLAFFLKRYIII
ncbi:MAG: hypothetical protein IJN57_08655, partial [Oscillospiraceae bacterium]|nr:hypothetical protein [Oscillospiraceae bacterium]